MPYVVYDCLKGEFLFHTQRKRKAPVDRVRNVLNELDGKGENAPVLHIRERTWSWNKRFITRVVTKKLRKQRRSE